MENLALIEEVAFEEEDKICPNCGNVYEIIKTEENYDKNTCGHIRCVSCGMFIEV